MQKKSLLLLPLLLSSSLAYMGGPEQVEKPSSTGEFYFGGGAGVAKGLDEVFVNASQFVGSGGTGNVRNNYIISDKGSPLYTAVAGYNFNSYIGVYFDYIDWGSQQLVGVSGT